MIPSSRLFAPFHRCRRLLCALASRPRRTPLVLLAALSVLSHSPARGQTPSFTTLVEFSGTTGSFPGRQPLAQLYQHSDGLLYGSTLGGGASDYGTVFKVTNTGTYTLVRSFQGASTLTPGFFPYGGVYVHSDGAIWGTAGGNDSLPTSSNPGYGNWWKITAAGTFQSPLYFAGLTSGNKGRLPRASLTPLSGKLYGTTSTGGASNAGTIFSVDINTQAVAYHVDFTGNGATNKGSTPIAQLVDGGDGFLYGSTLDGGTGGFGTLFKFQPGQSTVTTLVNFTDIGGANPGKHPYDALFKASDGNFYGTTANGGAFSLGTVFKLTPAGAHTVLAEFTGTTGAFQGANPIGRLAQHSNGLLYGTTFSGGVTFTNQAGQASSHGTVYSITTGGLLTPKLIQFTGKAGSFKGTSPWNGLIRGADGNLYGTTRWGGTGTDDGFGTIFKISVPAFSPPSVVTTAASGVTGTEATLSGTVNPNGASTTYVFDYGTTTNYGNTTSVTSAGAGTAVQNVSASISGLANSTLYHFRLRATNDAGIVNGSDLTFTTNSGTPVLPVVTTGSATAVEDTTATLNGTVKPNGSTTTWQFEYGTTASYGSTAPATAGNAGSGTGTENVSTALTGLLSGTTYFFRLTASNTAGPAAGTQGTFTTSGLPPEPTVVTGITTNITGTTARLTGTINPRGAQAFWQFEWGFSPAFDSVAPAIAGTTSAVSSDVPVSAEISGLLPSSTIFYRLTTWRSNQASTIYGFNSFFSTPALPGATAEAAIGISTSGGTLTGTVNPQGRATTWQFEYGEGGFDNTLPVSPGNAGSGSSAVSVSVTLSGLAPGTTIQYRVKAVSSAGTFVSGIQTFTTYQPPTSVTGTASGLTATGATLSGTVNPNGFAATYQFQYGTTPAYGQSTAVTAAGSGTSPVSASATLSGLLPGTTYYYRLTGSSTHGSASGLSGTFTTSPNVRSWRQQHFGTMENTGTANNDADPDGDGVNNLLEYAFGMNPSLRDSYLQPIPTWNGANLIISFSKPATVSDILYAGEVSTNLVNWSPIANSGGGNAVTFSAPVSTTGRNYMRVRVALIP